MRILFLITFLLIPNKGFTEWKYVKDSLKDDGKITERIYQQSIKINVNGKIKKEKIFFNIKNLSWKISKNYKKGKNCEPFQIFLTKYKNIVLDTMYTTNECVPCIEKKGLCGRNTLIADFSSRKSFDYLKSQGDESQWHREVENDGIEILTMDELGSVYRSIHIAFGNRESLMIESRKVKYQNQLYPTYRVAMAKFNTKNRKILTKISNFTDIYEEEIITQIELLFSKIYESLKNPKEVTITEEEAKIIFASHVDATHTKYQTRD
jgi:hypothetical protein